MSSYLRPDEQVAESNIKRMKESDEKLKRGVKTAVNLGTSALGIGAAAKVAPFLSPYIPFDLAMKGINKVSPQIGNFLKKGQEMGLDVKEGMNFIKDKIDKAQASKTPEKGNIIRQYSDKLDEFLNKEIQSGRSPIQAGALARANKDFTSIIKKIEKDHKANWSDIISSVYGIAEQAQPQQMQPQPQQQAPMQAQGQPQQPGANPNDAALLAALQKILQM